MEKALRNENKKRAKSSSFFFFFRFTPAYAYVIFTELVAHLFYWNTFFLLLLPLLIPPAFYGCQRLSTFFSILFLYIIIIVVFSFSFFVLFSISRFALESIVVAVPRFVLPWLLLLLVVCSVSCLFFPPVFIHDLAKASTTAHYSFSFVVLLLFLLSLSFFFNQPFYHCFQQRLNSPSFLFLS